LSRILNLPSEVCTITDAGTIDTVSVVFLLLPDGYNWYRRDLIGCCKTVSTMIKPLPEFKNPPVTEVAISVQFDRLDITNTQMGLVWQRYRQRFKRIEEKPELDPEFENFGLTERGAN